MCSGSNCAQVSAPYGVDFCNFALDTPGRKAACSSDGVSVNGLRYLTEPLTGRHGSDESAGAESRGGKSESFQVALRQSYVSNAVADKPKLASFPQ